MWQTPVDKRGVESTCSMLCYFDSGHLLHINAAYEHSEIVLFLLLLDCPP